jgi:SHS2 domain-containing protein
MNAMPTVLDQLSPSHEIADHVSEVRLRVRAGSLGDLLEEAGRAVAQLQLRGADAARGTWRMIEISARDRAALLVDWLNELIFPAGAKRWVGADFEVDSAQDGRVRARGGSGSSAPRHCSRPLRGTEYGLTRCPAAWRPR